jgi:hydrogenase/urease accessory protein HupE
MLRTSAAAFLATAGMASAHPGHEAAVAQGLAHWLTDPAHWAVLALGAVVLAEIGRRVVRRVARRRAGKTDP